MHTPHTALAESGPLLFSRSYLAKLILPLVVEQFLAVAIGMADTVMVATCGEAVVSAVSLVDSISQLLIQVFAAFATGGAVVASQYLGQRDSASANTAAKQLVYLCLLVSLSIAALGLPFHRQILRGIFGAIEMDVMVSAQAYFWIIILSYPFLALFNASAALFRSMGNSKTPMLVSLWMNLINIAGNAYLIFVLGWGAAGAAAATLASRLVGATIMLVLTCNKRRTIHINKLFHFEWHPEMIKRILRVGIPSGIENSTFNIGKLLVQSLTATFGTVAIAANAITNNVCSFMNVPGAAIGLASITIVGQCVGAGNYRQATHYSKSLLTLVYGAVLVVCLPLYLFAPQIVSIFNLSPEASEMAIFLVRMTMVVSVVVWPTAFTIPNFLRAAGDVKYPMVISLVSMWTFRVVCSYVLGQWLGMGLPGVWIAMYIDWVFRTICFVYRFAKGGWKNKQVI